MLCRYRALHTTSAVLPKFATPSDVSNVAGGVETEGHLVGEGMTSTIGYLSGTIDAALFRICKYATGVHDTVQSEVRYAPGCPTGDSAMSWAVRATGVFFGASTLGVPAGTYGVGAWYTAPAGSVVSGGAVGLWVPF